MPSSISESAPAASRYYLLAGRRNKYYVGVGWPHRRLRQHHGLLAGGAARTAQERPWVLVLELHGFREYKAALQGLRSNGGTPRSAVSTLLGPTPTLILLLAQSF